MHIFFAVQGELGKPPVLEFLQRQLTVVISVRILKHATSVNHVFLLILQGHLIFMNWMLPQIIKLKIYAV